jgi:hypothetical protein
MGKANIVPIKNLFVYQYVIDYLTQPETWDDPANGAAGKDIPTWHRPPAKAICSHPTGDVWWSLGPS